MKKFIFIAVSLIFISVIILMVSPPGQDIYDEYMNRVPDSKLGFRSKDKFDTAIQEKKTDCQGAAFVAKPIPETATKEEIEAWLKELSLTPARVTMIEQMLSKWGVFTYQYGGAGRSHYKEDNCGGLPIDCSAMVSWAYWKVGIDLGCQNTNALASSYGGSQVTKDTAMPGDIVVRAGSHTELLLGWTASGKRVCIGIGSGTGPHTTVGSRTLDKADTIMVRPPELAEKDKEYYNNTNCHNYEAGEKTVKVQNPGVSNNPDTEFKLYTPKNANGKLICIDPGHGPNPPQTSGYYSPRDYHAPDNDETEGMICLGVGLELKDLLLSEGYSVLMTRVDNTTVVPNSLRPLIANEQDVDLMITIHMNAGGGDYSFTVVPGDLDSRSWKSAVTKFDGIWVPLANKYLSNTQSHSMGQASGISVTAVHAGMNDKYPNFYLEFAFIDTDKHNKLVTGDSGHKGSAKVIFEAIKEYYK